MLAFVHIEKCAGQTIHWMLRSSYGLRHCDVLPWQGYPAMRQADPFTAEDLQRLRRVYPNLRSIAGHRVRIYSDLDALYPDIRYFTLIREPLKRHASNFQYLMHRKHQKLDFEEWICNRAWRANWQTRMLAGTDNIDDAIRLIQESNVLVGLVEHFDESLLMLKGSLETDLDISYERKNVASDNTIANQLLHSERTRQILIEQNKADLELYRYVKNELFPKYRREYGSSLATDLMSFQQNHGRFNRWNVLQARIYRNLVYKQVLRLYRLRYSPSEKVT